MDNLLIWVGCFCFLVAGIQVIRLIKLSFEEKKEMEKEEKRKQEEEEKRINQEKELIQLVKKSIKDEYEKEIMRKLKEEARQRENKEGKGKNLYKQDGYERRKQHNRNNRDMKQRPIGNKNKNDANKNYNRGVNRDIAISPELWCIAGNYANNYISLKQEILFGRDHSCNLVFPADMPFVSRKHCVLKYDWKKEMFCLTDLNSSYGTFLGNGKKLSPGESVWLAINEEFYIGKGERFRVGIRIEN